MNTDDTLLEDWHLNAVMGLICATVVDTTLIICGITDHWSLWVVAPLSLATLVGIVLIMSVVVVFLYEEITTAVKNDTDDVVEEWTKLLAKSIGKTNR